MDITVFLKAIHDHNAIIVVGGQFLPQTLEDYMTDEDAELVVLDVEGFDLMTTDGLRARQLFMLLRDNPKATFVLYGHNAGWKAISGPVFQNVLKAACETEGARTLAWHTANKSEEFEFTGKIILKAANAALLNPGVRARCIWIDLNGEGIQY